MFWICSLAITLAASFVKLGAALVKVKFLTIGMQCAGVAFAILISALSWNKSGIQAKN